MTKRPGDLVVKDPDAELPQTFDWSAWLAGLGGGVVVGTSEFIITGPDDALTASHESIVTGSQHTQVILAGGTMHGVYTVTNRVTTSGGLVTADQSIEILVESQ